jgi:TonB family protein
MQDLIIKYKKDKYKNVYFILVSVFLHLILGYCFYSLKMKSDYKRDSNINLTLENSYQQNNENNHKQNKHLKVEKKQKIDKKENQESAVVKESLGEKLDEIEEFVYMEMIYNNTLKNYNLNKKPYYPMIARQKKWEGVVMLKLYVDKNGKINEIILAKSSGYKILDESAVKSVKDWKLINNYNKNIYIIVPIEFKLQ